MELPLVRVRPTLDLERAGVRSIIIFRLGGRFGQAHGQARNDRSLDVGARRLRMFEHLGTRYRRLHLVPRHQVAQGAEILVIDVNFHWDTLFLLFDGGTGSPGCGGSGHTSISSLRAPLRDIPRSLPSAPRVIRPRRRRRYGWHSTGLGSPVTGAEVCARLIWAHAGNQRRLWDASEASQTGPSSCLGGILSQN